jgi:hypothetical protein
MVCHYAECLQAECRILFIFSLKVVMLNVIKLKVVATFGNVRLDISVTWKKNAGAVLATLHFPRNLRMGQNKLVFVPVRPFQPNIMFVSKTGAHPREAI